MPSRRWAILSSVDEMPIPDDPARILLLADRGMIGYSGSQCNLRRKREQILDGTVDHANWTDRN